MMRSRSGANLNDSVTNTRGTNKSVVIDDMPTSSEKSDNSNSEEKKQYLKSYMSGEEESIFTSSRLS